MASVLIWIGTQTVGAITPRAQSESPGVIKTYSWPVSDGQAKVSTHYRVFVTVEGEKEQELQVLQSAPLVTKRLPDGSFGQDLLAKYTLQRSFSFVPISYRAESGKEVTIRVVSLDKYSSDDVQLSPKNYHLEGHTGVSSVSFTVNKDNQYIAVNFNDPHNIVTIPAGEGNAITNYSWIKDMLCIYVDPQETLLPDASRQKIVYYSKNSTAAELKDADVIYFKPGYYNLKKDGARGSVINEHGGITLASNQKIYIAGGGFVEGYVLRANYSDANQGLFGRGILTGRQYVWQPGDSNRLMGQLVQAGNHALFDGVIIMESPHHGIVPTSDATFRNVKFLGWHCNNDGLRPGLNSKISNCFIRACDDFFYNYTLDVKDCVLWPAFNGSIMTNGWQYFDIGGSKMENIDIIFPEWLNMGNNKGLMMSQNEYKFNPPSNAPTTIFRNIRIEGTIPGFINLKPNSEYKNYNAETNTNPGSSAKIQLTSMSDLGWMGNILFENVSIENEVGDKNRGVRANLITGASDIGGTGAPIVKGHPEAIWWVKDIVFRNVTIGGVQVTNQNKDNWFVIDAKTTQNIQFDEPSAIVDLQDDSEKSPNGGVAYNLLGQIVGKDYKGIAIKNNKKFWMK